MNLEKSLKILAKQGKLKKQKTDFNYLDGLLLAARRNFEAALLIKDRFENI